jgi:hypothetical protein
VNDIAWAKRHVAAFLETTMPAWLTAYRLEHDLLSDPDDGDKDRVFPDPVAYLPTEPYSLDRWPMIAVAGVSTPSVRRTGYGEEPDAVSYDVTYSLRVFVWVNVEEFERAILHRDAYVGLVRACLLDAQTLKVADEALLLLEDTLNESYSDVTPVKGNRFVAGAFIGFNVRSREALARGSSGTVEHAIVETDVLPHPALT